MFFTFANGYLRKLKWSRTHLNRQVDLEKKEFLVTKTLGIVWIAEDKFSFWFSQPKSTFQVNLTLLKKEPRVNKSRTTSGDIKPNFYTKVKRSCQKVSLEKPENLKRKFYQRKEDGIWRRRTLTRMLTVTTQTLLGVNRRVTQTQTSTHDQRYRIQSKGRRHNVFQKKLEYLKTNSAFPARVSY